MHSAARQPGNQWWGTMLQRVRRGSQNILLLSVSVLFCLAASEIGLRFVSGIPLLEIADYRTKAAIRDLWQGQAEYDPLLGWRMVPFFSASGGVTSAVVSYPRPRTIEHGLRSNGPNNDHLRTGGVLAIGASFTAGSEVEDYESWPAQLEELIKRPVANSGVGGYGVDQMVLRAEQLIPVVEPDTVVVDILPENIMIAGLSVNGRPKPYFKMEDGRLVHHNYPVPKFDPPVGIFDRAKEYLGYSYGLHRIFGTYARNFWYAFDGQTFRNADNDELEVSCKLLERLHAFTEERGIRLIISLQYGGELASTSDKRPESSEMLLACARARGIQTVDEFDALRQLRREAPEKFNAIYVPHPGGKYGHKSRSGNAHVALMIRDALNEPRLQRIAPLPDDSSSPERDVPARNLLSRSEGLTSFVSGRHHGSLEIVGDVQSIRQQYRVTATGPTGLHFVVLGPLTVNGGSFTASMEVRAEGTPSMRLQLQDGKENGIIGDFHLRRRQGGNWHWRLGGARRIASGIEPLGGGWFRVWVTTDMPRSDATSGFVIVQLLDDVSRTDFAVNGETFLLRALQVTKGRAVIPYTPPISALREHAG
jgi:hypothetical protein